VAAAVEAVLAPEDCVGEGDGDVGDGDDDGGDVVGLAGEVAVFVGDGDEDEEYLDVGAGDDVGLCCAGPDPESRGTGSKPVPGLAFAFEPDRLAPPAAPARPAPAVPPVPEPPAVGPPGVTTVLWV